MKTIPYRPEIDGLRAISVIPVLIFHLGAGWLPGGFIGVDVFFVISGYLITSIIVTEHERGTFSFLNFWLRRVKRIFPALLSMIVITTLVGQALLFDADVRELGKQGVAALLSFANVYMWLLAGDYWGPQAEGAIFLHTWSLSVEEQFYLLFPGMLILVLNKARTLVVKIFGALVLISYVVYIFGVYSGKLSAFYLLPARAWELGCGCLLAIKVVKTGPFKDQRLLSLLGLLLILLSYFFVSGHGGYVGYLTAPVVGAILLLAFAQSRSNLVCAMLSAPPLVYIGRISYSLYIWHWPIILLSKNFFLDGGQMLPLPLIVALIFMVSVLSYHFIEGFRKEDGFYRSIAVLFASAVTFSAVLANQGGGVKPDISLYNPTVWDGDLYNTSMNLQPLNAHGGRLDGVQLVKKAGSTVDAYASGGILKKYGGETPDIMVIGDSHGLMWSGVIDDIAQEMGITISFYSADGTSPFFEIPVKHGRKTFSFSEQEKKTFDEKRLFYLAYWKPRLVILSARWSTIDDVREARDLIEFIGEQKARILLIEQPPELFFDGAKNTAHVLSHMKIRPANGFQAYVQASDNKEAVARGGKIVHQLVQDYSFCDRVEVSSIYSKEGKALVLDGLNVLYTDNNHLSRAGANLAKARLKEKIIANLRSPP